MYTCLTWLVKYWCYLKEVYEHDMNRDSKTITDTCYAKKITHNKNFPQFFFNNNNYHSFTIIFSLNPILSVIFTSYYMVT